MQTSIDYHIDDKDDNIHLRSPIPNDNDEELNGNSHFNENFSQFQTPNQTIYQEEIKYLNSSLSMLNSVN